MKLFERPSSLPLGVDMGPESVSIVAADAAADGFVVRETETREVPHTETTPLDLRIAETIRAILVDLRTRERRCVLAAPFAEVTTRVFRVPPGMKRREAEQAAELEADALVDWPACERLVALDPIPGKADEMLLSVGRNSTLERIVGIARAAGLHAVAIDVPACAWQRAIVGTDALLDCSTERAALVIFGRPVGVTHLFAPRLIDERLASQVRTAFVDARRDGMADVQRLALLGPRFRFESIEELLRSDGYHIERVRLGGFESPTWAFAYGLASWSVAPRGLEGA